MPKDITECEGVKEKLDFVNDLCYGKARSSEETSSSYNKWAGKYEKDVEELVYNGPEAGARHLANLLKDKSALILDLAAGTGLVGQQLHKIGYKNLHALDGAQGMLDIAASKNIYKKLICSFVSGTPTSGIAENTYDALVTVGAFGGNHITDFDVIFEICRIVKPGGLVSMVVGDNAYGPEKTKEFHKFLKERETDGLWTMVTKSPVKNWFSEEAGHKMIYEIN